LTRISVKRDVSRYERLNSWHSPELRERVESRLLLWFRLCLRLLDVAFLISIRRVLDIGVRMHLRSFRLTD
jgi:hypothetical protein